MGCAEGRNGEKDTDIKYSWVYIEEETRINMFRSVKTFEDSRTYQVLVQAALICISIGSIIATSMAIHYLRGSSYATDYIRANWETKPVTAGVFVEREQECPHGFEEATQPITWPGAEGYGCACHSGSLDSFGNQVKSSYGSCSIGQQQAGCIEDKGLGPISMQTWRGGKFCVKREGQAVADFGWNFNERPNPINGLCPENYKKCGNQDGDFDNDFSTCQPDTVDCPVTFFVSDNQLGELPETVGYNETHNPFLEGVPLSRQVAYFICLVSLFPPYIS